MKFINFYSQNFEDVMLERCFADIDHGYYIDVGAQHEEYDSVTKYFYDKGWSGINIEPLPEWCQSFNHRERDIVIQCAAGSENKVLKINAVPNTGLSSLSPINTKCIEEAGMQLEEREIQVRTLNSILESLEIKKKKFEFLKIDVEGFELEVFKGVDLFMYRPKIILCEVTQPNSQEFVGEYEEICKVVEMQGYKKVYFDGLNQWWAEETIQNDMAKHFILPPTVFDSTLISPASSTNARKELNQALNNSTQLQIRYEKVLEENSNFLQQLEQERDEKSGIIQQLEQGKEQKLELLRRFEHEAKERLDLLEQLEQGRREKLELLKQFEHEEKERHDLLQQLEQERGEKSELTQKLEQERGEKSELTQKLEQEKGENSELTQKLEQERGEKSELTQKLEQERGEKSELTQKLEQEKGENSELIRRLEEIYSSRKWKIAELIGKLNIKSWRIEK